MNSEFRVDMLPSFCNAWPVIQIDINGKTLWQQTVNNPQTITVNFELQDTNQIYIKYLNKRNGPDVYDTEIDAEGNILKDQSCILRNFMIGRSRCDFLLYQLDYFNDDQTIQHKAYGFMAKKGYFLIEFPRDIYSWIVDNRVSTLYVNNSRSSSLDYFANYLGHPQKEETLKTIEEMKSLIDQLKNNA